MDFQTILVVDNDIRALRAMRRALENSYFMVETAQNGSAALAHIKAYGLPHLMVVSLGIGSMAAYALCETVLSFSDIPIVMVSGGADDAVLALEQCADDFICKPIVPVEFAARVKRVLSRARNAHADYGHAFKVDEWLQIDIPRQVVVTPGGVVKLTSYEAKVLYILLANAGRFVSSQFISRRVWDDDAKVKTLKVLIHRIRRKAEKDPSNPAYIISERGSGYQFAVKH